MKCICAYCKQEKEHCAKGFCHPCYARYNRRGTPEYYEPFTTSYYERNKEKIKKYCKEHKKERSLYNKKYYKNNKKEISEYKKEWYLKNRERILQKIKKENK